MIKLSEISTLPPEDFNKSTTDKLTKKYAEGIEELSWKLLAERKRNLLIVFQGMDSSGKDGATKAAFKYTSPSVVSAYSFKKPSDEEFAHDFLWRVHKQAPEKGKIQVYVRSHYEDILIQRVHKWIDEERVDNRIEAINAYEKLLTFDNHTTVVKFYLHLSKERQKEKLIERIEMPRKNWKHNDGDWAERKLWDEYRRCYEDAINRADIPWHIVPADKRWYRNYFVTKTIYDILDGMNLHYPPFETKPDIDYNA